MHDLAAHLLPNHARGTNTFIGFQRGRIDIPQPAGRLSPHLGRCQLARCDFDLRVGQTSLFANMNYSMRIRVQHSPARDRNQTNGAGDRPHRQGRYPLGAPGRLGGRPCYQYSPATFPAPVQAPATALLRALPECPTVS
jgi:hypothetical protein